MVARLTEGLRSEALATLPQWTHDPARDAIRVCDGGAQFWGAVFDPGSGSFSDVQFNGPPAGR